MHSLGSPGPQGLPALDMKASPQQPKNSKAGPMLLSTSSKQGSSKRPGIVPWLCRCLPGWQPSPCSAQGTHLSALLCHQQPSFTHPTMPEWDGCSTQPEGTAQSTTELSGAHQEPSCSKPRSPECSYSTPRPPALPYSKPKLPKLPRTFQGPFPLLFAPSLLCSSQDSSPRVPSSQERISWLPHPFSKHREKIPQGYPNCGFFPQL